jgi:hypothetical protein
MEHSGTERLRERLRRHNRLVLALTVATFIAAAVLWAGLYFVVWWLFLLGGTAAKSVDFHPVSGPIISGFVTTGALLCAFAWLSRLLRADASARDHKSCGEHFLDLLLAVPRLTLSIFGTGGAAARLTETELEHAWNLLRRMDEAGKPVPEQELPVDIPDPAMRRKIVLALQLSGVIEIRATSAGQVLAFRDEEARRLGQERVRLRF